MLQIHPKIKTGKLGTGVSSGRSGQKGLRATGPKGLLVLFYNDQNCQEKHIHAYLRDYNYQNGTQAGVSTNM